MYKECKGCQFLELPPVEAYKRWPNDVLPILRSDYQQRKQEYDLRCNVQATPLTRTITKESTEVLQLDTQLQDKLLEYNKLTAKIRQDKVANETVKRSLEESQQKTQSLENSYKSNNEQIKIAERTEKTKNKEIEELKVRLERASRKPSTTASEKIVHTAIDQKYCVFLAQLLKAQESYINAAPTTADIPVSTLARVSPTSEISLISSQTREQETKPMNISSASTASTVRTGGRLPTSPSKYAVLTQGPYTGT